MSEIVTYNSDTEALKWRPFREGYEYALYYQSKTKLYQWMNDATVAKAFGLTQIFPTPDPTLGGFGLSPFGTTPFGS